MKKYKISIITVTKNSEKFLLQNILSVKSQSYKNLEHIIVDGNSKDKTINMLSKALSIRHKPTKLEYTIDKITVVDKKPVIIAYRYYSKPGSDKKVYIQIQSNDFKNYETV